MVAVFLKNKHHYKVGVGHEWQVCFPEVGNNNEFIDTYNAIDMEHYCIGGDSEGVITIENVEQLTATIEDMAGLFMDRSQ